MKVTTKQPEPQKPNVIIELTPEEAAKLAMYCSSDEVASRYTESSYRTIVEIAKLIQKLGYKGLGD